MSGSQERFRASVPRVIEVARDLTLEMFLKSFALSEN